VTEALVALKRLTKIIAGQSPPSDAVTDFEGDGLPFLQGNAEFHTESPIPIHRCDSASKICDPGDILISVRAPVGALNIADSHYGIGRGLCAVRPSKINQRFLWWLLHTNVTRLQSLATGSTYDAVSAEDIGSLRVTVPSHSAQRIITAYLDAETAQIDALTTKKQRMIEFLNERFEAVVFNAVTRGFSGTGPLKPSGLSWIEEIPVGWGTPPVSTHFELQLGKMLNKKATNGPNQYPYLRNANVQWDRFDLDDLASMHFDSADRRQYELRPGDLLVCEGGEVGRAAVWKGEVTECYFQKAIHRVRPRDAANSRYLMYCLRAAARHSVFAADGNLSTIAHLTSEQLRAYRFPWPPQDEQAAIVERLDMNAHRTAKVKGHLSRQIDLLLEHRQALITAAVTGELDIP
jgi:type I restriction enzyme, S subunit